jgi:hypothetical protein
MPAVRATARGAGHRGDAALARTPMAEPFGAGNQLAALSPSGVSAWIQMSSDPSLLRVRPSVVLPML